MAQADRLETFVTEYYTGTQASIFIGDIWVDEVFGISFSASQSIIPIFGYASTFFDAAAKGKVLVQGYFEINFVDEGYLYAILNERLKLLNPDDKGIDEDLIEQAVKKSPGQIRFTDSEEVVIARGVRTAQEVIQDQIQLLKEVSEGKRPNGRDRRQALGSIMNEISQLDIRQLNQLGSELNAPDRGAQKKSIIYNMIPFKLTGYFGNPELTEGKTQGTYKEIVNCFLVGNEMVVDATEEVVRERYSFIAQMHT